MLRPYTSRQVAERRPFGADRHDPDVPGHAIGRRIPAHRHPRKLRM